MRKYYLDNIRWITVVLVVFYHVIYMFNAVATDGVVGPFYERQYQDIILYILYPWFMVLLFIVSGMCARYYLDNHTLREFVRVRTRKLLVPGTLGVLVFGWLQGYVNMALGGAFDTMPDTIPGPVMYFIMALSGTGVLWFVQMLWLFSMLLALIRKYEKGKLYTLCGKSGMAVILLLVVPVYLSGLVLNMPVVSVYRFGIYGFAFFLGYFLFSHDEVVCMLQKYCILFITAALLLAVAYTARYYGDNYAKSPAVNSILAAVYAYTACLAILGGMRRWGNKSSRFSAYMTGRSFGLYVFHYLPLSATAYLLHKYTDVPAFPSYLITTLAAFAGSFFLYETISRIPVLRFCVLGMKKDGNKTLDFS